MGRRLHEHARPTGGVESDEREPGPRLAGRIDVEVRGRTGYRATGQHLDVAGGRGLGGHHGHDRCRVRPADDRCLRAAVGSCSRACVEQTDIGHVVERRRSEPTLQIGNEVCVRLVEQAGRATCIERHHGEHRSDLVDAVGVQIRRTPGRRTTRHHLDESGLGVLDRDQRHDTRPTGQPTTHRRLSPGRHPRLLRHGGRTRVARVGDVVGEPPDRGGDQRIERRRAQRVPLPREFVPTHRQARGDHRVTGGHRLRERHDVVDRSVLEQRSRVARADGRRLVRPRDGDGGAHGRRELRVIAGQRRVGVDRHAQRRDRTGRRAANGDPVRIDPQARSVRPEPSDRRLHVGTSVVHDVELERGVHRSHHGDRPEPVVDRRRDIAALCQTRRPGRGAALVAQYEEPAVGEDEHRAFRRRVAPRCVEVELQCHRRTIDRDGVAVHHVVLHVGVEDRIEVARRGVRRRR